MSDEFREKLLEVMRERGMNARRLSLAAKLNPTAVRDILQGKSATPRTDTVLRIADALDVAPSLLLDLLGVKLEDVDERLLSSRQKPGQMELQELKNYDGKYYSIKDIAIDLEGAPGVNFTLANLQNANLSGSDFRSSIFAGADLRNANLSNANLARCIFSNADLRGANLEGADLRRAILAFAKLDGAILVGARLEGAILDGVELSKAILHRR